MITRAGMPGKTNIDRCYFFVVVKNDGFLKEINRFFIVHESYHQVFHWKFAPIGEQFENY